MTAQPARSSASIQLLYSACTSVLSRMRLTPCTAAGARQEAPLEPSEHGRVGGQDSSVACRALRSAAAGPTHLRVHHVPRPVPPLLQALQLNHRAAAAHSTKGRQLTGVGRRRRFQAHALPPCDCCAARLQAPAFFFLLHTQECAISAMQPPAGCTAGTHRHKVRQASKGHGMPHVAPEVDAAAGRELHVAF